MATRKPAAEKAALKQGWWESIPEKAVVALVTAAVTGTITLVGPSVQTWIYSTLHHTNGRSSADIAFQMSKWKANDSCAANPIAIWHPASEQRQIDATICPSTGDILVVMKDSSGRQFQWWPDMKGLTQQFEMSAATQTGSALVPAALAAPAPRATVIASAMPPRSTAAQQVLCQIMMPDGRGLRRRLLVGPNQCIELLIDTFTGQVVYQRYIPCVANCFVNV